MEIIEVAPQVNVNPYRADMEKLLEQTNVNPNAAGAFVVDSADVSKTRFKIAKAANELDKTASLVSSEPTDKSGKQVRLVFKLKDRHRTGPRKSRTNSEETTGE